MLWTIPVRWLAPLVVAANFLTVAIGSSAAQPLTTVNDAASSGGRLAPPQVALIGRRMLQTLAPAGTPTVTVFATTWGRAETILLGSPNRAPGPAARLPSLSPCAAAGGGGAGRSAASCWA